MFLYGKKEWLLGLHYLHYRNSKHSLDKYHHRYQWFNLKYYETVHHHIRSDISAGKYRIWTCIEVIWDVQSRFQQWSYCCYHNHSLLGWLHQDERRFQSVTILNQWHLRIDRIHHSTCSRTWHAKQLVLCRTYCDSSFSVNSDYDNKHYIKENFLK